MMRNKHVRNKKSDVVKVLLSATLIALVFLSILELSGVTHIFRSSPATTHGPTLEQKQEADQAAAETKQELINEPKGDDTSSATSTPTKSIDLSAKQESNDTVTVFTKLVGYSDGSCELVVINGSKSNTQIAMVIYQPEFSSCAGFSVPTSSIGTGTWSIKLSVTSSGKTESKTISLEVN